MARNFLTKEEMVEIVRLKYVEGLTQCAICDELYKTFGVRRGKSTVGDFLRSQYGPHKEFWKEHAEKPVAGAQLLSPDERRKRLSGKAFVFTTAQNNTWVHQGFLKSLELFAESRDAEIIMGRSLYDKNSFQRLTDDHDDEIWFDPKISSYIDSQSMQVADDLIFCGELNILPTAVTPMSGLHNYTKSASGIIPHATIALEGLPSHIDEPNKIMYTTGSVTHPNFIEKKTGQKAEFHHAIGALYVEFDEDGEWYARHLRADSKTGAFYDLTEYFTPDGIEDRTGCSVEAINWGDIHAEKLDPYVAQQAFGIQESVVEGRYTALPDGNGSIMDVLRPRYQFMHDTSDFSIRNHHNVKDPHFRFKMFSDDTDSVEDDMRCVSTVISSMSRDYCSTVVVESNHDLALVKWLKEQDYRNDPANAVFFLETQLAYYKSIKENNDDFHIFKYTMERLNDDILDKDVHYLNDGDYFVLFPESKDPIQCGYHGHKGANGARGSTKGFTKIGKKINLGHSHTPMLYQNVACAGVSGKLRMGYNDNAPSSWSHSHIITYVDGKRIIITQKYKGKWRK